MRIYLDLDSRRLLATPTRPLTALEFKRRDNDLIELQFLRDATVQQLLAVTTVRVGIKPAGDYDAEFLAVATLSRSGWGTSTVYAGVLNLHSAAMAAAFADEPIKVAAMLEVEWVQAPDYVFYVEDIFSSSKTLPTTIHNDVIRGDEGEPAEMPLFYYTTDNSLLATQAEATAGEDNTKWMSPLRTAQAIAELAATDWDSVSGKPSTFPPASHTHAIADVTGLQTALDGKQALGSYAAESHTHPLSALTQSGANTGQVATFDGTSWVPQDASGGVTSYNDLTNVPSTFPPSTHTHAATDITSGTLALASIPTGTTSTTVALGNHTHGNITTGGAIGTTSGVPVITGTSGILQAGSFGTTAGTFAAGNHTHGGMLTATGGITTIAVVALMPDTPAANTLYIVTA